MLNMSANNLPAHLRPRVEAGQLDDAQPLSAAAGLHSCADGRLRHPHRPLQRHLLHAAVKLAHLQGGKGDGVRGTQG